MSQNLQNFAKFQKFQLENLVDFEPGGKYTESGKIYTEKRRREGSGEAWLLAPPEVVEVQASELVKAPKK